MPLLSILIAVPFAAAIALLMAPRGRERLCRNMARAAVGITFLLSLAMFLLYPQMAEGPGGFKFYQKVSWVESLGISFQVGVDGINAGLILMSAAVALAASFAGWEITRRQREFYFLFLLMTGGIVGAFASLDIFFFYFFHELALVPTFIMIGVWGRGESRHYATFKITVYLTIGAMLSLVGLAALYLQSGARTFDMIELANHLETHPLSASQQNLIFPLLLFGFGILVSLWPFHTWAPIGYGAAPAFPDLPTLPARSSFCSASGAVLCLGLRSPALGAPSLLAPFIASAPFAESCTAPLPREVGILPTPSLYPTNCLSFS